MLTNDKNFSDFIEDENLQKQNFFIYFCKEEENIYIQQTELLYLWFKCFNSNSKYIYELKIKDENLQKKLHLLL